MLKIDCPRCKEKVTVNMYFSQPRLITQKNIGCHQIYYTAHVVGRAICPDCGEDIVKDFESEVYPSDIIDLALRRECHV